MEKNVLKRKICLIGDHMVGKTSLIRRFVHNEFSDEYISTIGTQISRKSISIDNPAEDASSEQYDLTLSIWDIIGQREYRSLALRHFVEARGALIVCDLTRKETFDSLNEWLNPLYYTAGNIPTLLLINKNDLEDKREINEDIINEISDNLEVPYLFTSAKTGENVEEAFRQLGKKIVEFSMKQGKPRTIIQVTDTITTDFCETMGGFEKGMPIFQEQFQKTGGEFSNPTKGDLTNLTQSLIEIIETELGPELAKEKENLYNELVNNMTQ